MGCRVSLAGLLWSADIVQHTVPDKLGAQVVMLAGSCDAFIVV